MANRCSNISWLHPCVLVDPFMSAPPTSIASSNLDHHRHPVRSIFFCRQRSILDLMAIMLSIRHGATSSVCFFSDGTPSSSSIIDHHQSHTIDHHRHRPVDHSSSTSRRSSLLSVMGHCHYCTGTSEASLSNKPLPSPGFSSIMLESNTTW